MSSSSSAPRRAGSEDSALVRARQRVAAPPTLLHAVRPARWRARVPSESSSSSSSRSSGSPPPPPAPVRPVSEASEASDAVHIDITDLDSTDGPPALAPRDTYRWAFLFENQRGITLFSTPYYTPQLLGPLDPPPYTIPSPDMVSKHQPTLSLQDYPLPDGDWKWASPWWIIDMRADGQVQQDGFEYNLYFRKHRWRPDIPPLGVGAYVRRRRWMRLMVLSASPGDRDNEAADSHDPISSSVSRPPSPIDPPNVTPDWKSIWKGDDADWSRIHRVLIDVGRDGLRLELWEAWLGTSRCPEHNHHHRQQWTEDLEPLPSEKAKLLNQSQKEHAHPDSPPSEWVENIVKNHAEEIMQLFVYPTSKAELVRLLLEANLGPAMELSLGPGLDLQFWSERKEVLELPQSVPDEEAPASPSSQ